MKRSLKILQLYVEEKNTLSQIAKKYDLTRQRVSQILLEYPEYKNRKQYTNRKVEKITWKCKYCRTEHTTELSKEGKYCNVKCWRMHKEQIRKNRKTQICARCGKRKKVSQFYKRHYNYSANKAYPIKYQYSSYCKECHKQWTIEWHKKNPKRSKEISRKAVKKYYEKKRIEAKL